jgi:hypothetical protein
MTTKPTATAKRGRPPVAASDKREHSARVNLTGRELKELYDAANEAGLTVSDYIRRRLLTGTKTEGK